MFTSFFVTVSYISCCYLRFNHLFIRRDFVFLNYSETDHLILEILVHIQDELSLCDIINGMIECLRLFIFFIQEEFKEEHSRVLFSL